MNFLSSKQLEDKLKWNVADAKLSEYPLWYAFQSTYKDLRTQKLKDMQRQSLRQYAEELLKEKIIEESIGNEIVPNMNKILINAFLKLDADLLTEALPNPASGKAFLRLGPGDRSPLVDPVS